MIFRETLKNLVDKLVCKKLVDLTWDGNPEVMGGKMYPKIILGQEIGGDNSRLSLGESQQCQGV
jgi:hypothetical protein